MHLTSRVSHPSATAARQPGELLGVHHPLVRDLERLDVARKQLVAVAGALAVGAAMLVTHAPSGLALAVAAAVVELLIVVRTAALLERRHLHTLDVIAEGRAELPLPAIDKIAARLGEARHRQQLIHSIEMLIDPRPGAFDVVVTPWQFARAELVIAVRAALLEIAGILQRPDASVEGIALMAQLLADGTSCLHREDAQLLLDELGRVRYVLLAAVL